MIKVNKLSIGVKKKKDIIPLLKNINLNILKGKISILTGESGIGKTIFAKTISGLLPKNLIITNGLFYIDNKEVEYSDIKKLTGKGVFYTPQNAKASLNPVLKIKTQFNDIKNIKHKEITDLMNEMEFDSPERILTSYPFELSEGECQRIIIIMGVLLRPKLFILDEPTTALDICTQSAIIEHIYKINKELKITILLITHNLSLLNNTNHNKPVHLSFL